MPTITTSASTVQVATDPRGHVCERTMRRRRFDLETNGRADVLVRVLALLRRRGCRIAAVEFHEADRHRPERFEVAVDAPARNEPRLEFWLVGLVDVIAVRRPLGADGRRACTVRWGGRRNPAPFGLAARRPAAPADAILTVGRNPSANAAQRLARMGHPGSNGYKRALPLAELILRHASVTTEHGTTHSIAFVFDMNRVFEDFLSVSLTEALRAHGVTVRLQHTGRHLDRERLIPLRPDITLWRAGRCVGVVDAKYKRLADERFPNADAYQMLAYCTAFGLPDGTLLYAHDAVEQDRTHHLTRGTTIRVRTVDVEAEPDKILRQVDAVATALMSAPRTRNEQLP